MARVVDAAEEEPARLRVACAAKVTSRRQMARAGVQVLKLVGGSSGESGGSSGGPAIARMIAATANSAVVSEVEISGLMTWHTPILITRMTARVDKTMRRWSWHIRAVVRLHRTCSPAASVKDSYRACR